MIVKHVSYIFVLFYVYKMYFKDNYYAHLCHGSPFSY